LETGWVKSLVAQSAHPLSVRICEALVAESWGAVQGFREVPGCGIEGFVSGHLIALGSVRWLRSNYPNFCPESTLPSTHSANSARQGSAVCLVIDGTFRGEFHLVSTLRECTKELIDDLGCHCRLALLSGDNDRERGQFDELFTTVGSVHFNQSPAEKLEYVQACQRRGEVVMMVGDGLNDAGALKQSDAGIAVVESIQAFSPASDVILRADRVVDLGRVLQFSQAVVRVVRSAFVISAIYNIVGLAIAASGRLSPIVCAILMPLSSVTVVVYATGVVAWRSRRLGEDRRQSVTAPLLKPAVNSFQPMEATV
jgi:Cu+-exporting ATPase